MASFGGVGLGSTGAAVFEVTTSADDEDFVHVHPDGSTVVIPANAKYVLVRDCSGESFSQIHQTAREAANRAIDIYFGQGGRPLQIAHKDSPYVVGWATPAGQVLRLLGRSQLSARALPVKVEVRDAEGNVVEQPPAPPRLWHESLRYYRVSESSSDLFDSFRNLYLAIEALLSDIVAPTFDADGHPEGDSRWLARAMRTVSSELDLSPYAPPSSKAPHNGIHEELYTNLRTAIFHAKKGRSNWTPQDWSSRETIVSARLRYARLYRALAAKYLAISYPVGGWYRGFWENMVEQSLAAQIVFVSNDPTKVAEEPRGQWQLQPADGDFMELPTTRAEDMAAAWRRGVIGLGDPGTINKVLGPVRRFGTLASGELALVESLEADLLVDGLARLEVVLLLEGRNYGHPRQDFES